MTQDLLVPRDTHEIMRLLHYDSRANIHRPKETFTKYIDEFISNYKSGRLPAHPLASLHVISCLKERKEHGKALFFWEWVVRQDDRYSGLATYGAAIEMLAEYGRSLEYCQEVYRHALARFPRDFNEYHLSPSAVTANPTKKTELAGTSLDLLQGLTKAQLLHGDWRSAYLSLDTALRLHPSQIPVRVLHFFLEERPVYEAVQVFCMMCQSGTIVGGQCFGALLDKLHAAQGDETGYRTNQDIMSAMVTALHFYIGSGGMLNSKHLSRFFSAIPTIARKSILLRFDDSSNSMGGQIVSELFALFSELNVALEITPFNALISMGGVIGDHALVSKADQDLTTAGLIPDRYTFRSLLHASGRFRSLAAVQSSWEALIKFLEESALELNSIDWATLARSASLAGNPQYVYDQLTERGVSEQKGLKRRIALALDDTDLAKIPGEEEGAINIDEEVDTIELIVKLINSFKELRLMIKDGQIRDLKTTGPARMSIFPWPHNPVEEWQSKLYTEVNGGVADPSLYANQSADTPRGPAQSIDKTPTGFALDEIRLRNWNCINNLLMQAELYEKRLEDSVDIAIKQRGPVGLSRTMQGLNLSKRRIAVAAHIKAHLQDVNYAAANPLTETQWRETILRLRKENIR